MERNEARQKREMEEEVKIKARQLYEFFNDPDPDRKNLDKLD